MTRCESIIEKHYCDLSNIDQAPLQFELFESCEVVEVVPIVDWDLIPFQFEDPLEIYFRAIEDPATTYLKSYWQRHWK